MAPMLQYQGMGGLFSICSPSTKITECLLVRAGHCLSEPLTVLDKVSLWISPGWFWEESHSNTITQSGNGLLFLLPPEILSFW